MVSNPIFIDLSKISDSDRLFDLLCYPIYDPKTFNSRLIELETLGIKSIELSGPTILNNNKILGKGTRGLVLKANLGNSSIAVKIRRIDSPRINLISEANIQLFANKFGIGPKIINYSDNCIAMELIEGQLLIDFFYKMDSVNIVLIKKTLESLLSQCYLLDLHGIDHGELSDLKKHVIINNRVNIIDFDSASLTRKPSNVTSCVQYLFIGGPPSGLLQNIFSIDREKLIITLKNYKRTPNYLNFIRIINLLKL